MRSVSLAICITFLIVLLIAQKVESAFLRQNNQCRILNSRCGSYQEGFTTIHRHCCDGLRCRAPYPDMPHLRLCSI